MPSLRDQDVPAQVRQVRRAFEEVYADLIDMSDWAGHSEESQADARLSRALAAHAVRIVTGCSARDAALTVIDGGADQGIDAIALQRDPARIYLVQAKWSRTGAARIKLDAVLKLLAGLRLIDSEEFSQFNPRGQELAQAAKDLMGEGAVPVTQVIAQMGTDKLSEEVKKALDNGEREFNKYGDLLEHRLIQASEIWAKVREDVASKPVDMTARLFPWFVVSTPYESYQGVVAADDVAGWIDAHGTNLFNLNIRNPLGLTLINNDLMNTLGDEPAHFWYFNNGITILCESVRKKQQSMRAPEQQPLILEIQGASVVNGAQTARAIADAMARDGDETAYAKVGVKVIVTGGNDEFAKSITQATNRQNHIEPRDYVTLDPVQSALMEEMRAELGLQYSVRRGELEPVPETGCTIVEAARALACSHTSSQYAARMAGSQDVLWERGTRGIYDVLFRPQPSPYQLWNSVLVLRATRRELAERQSKYKGRGVATIENGTYLIAHLVFRALGVEGMDEPDLDTAWFDLAAKKIPELVAVILPTLIATMDELYSERSQIRAICADVKRCRELANEVLERIKIGSPEADLQKYRAEKARKVRRPNAVHIILDQGLLNEGDPLLLQTSSSVEREALSGWLNENDKRKRATWINNRARPLLWAADGQNYSPSGLVNHIRELAKWEDRPVSTQGTLRWMTSDGDTLADLAWRTLKELEDPGDDDIS